jgi:hypothetical protein
MTPNDILYSVRSRSGSDESNTDMRFLKSDDEAFPFILNGNCDSYYSTSITPSSLYQGSQKIFREHRGYGHGDLPVIEMASPVGMVYAVDDEYIEGEKERRSPLMTISTQRKSKGSPRNVENAFVDGQLLDHPLVESKGQGYQLPFLNRRDC